MKFQHMLLIAALILLIAALIALPWAAGPTGKGDFIAYWSASRLLLQGKDPYDISNLRELQLQAYPERGYLIYTWNPPWLAVLLLPVAWLPFSSAVQVWMLVNLALLIVAGLAIWLSLTGDRSLRAVSLAVVATVLFPPSLAAMGAGQIVPWIFLASVAAIMWQLRNRHLVLAGALMPVMLLKPQVTFLVAALSVWHGIRQRQWRFFAAAVVSVLTLLVIATLLYPNWLASYLGNIGGRDVAFWLTPTLGGALFSFWLTPWIRYVGLIFVVAIPVFYRSIHLQPAWLVLGLTLSIGITVSPFGWSFDQVVLLPLILYMLDVRRRLKRWWLDLGLLATYFIPLIMHVMQVDEFNYIWVPWLTLALYLGVIRSGKRMLDKTLPLAEEVAQATFR